jgi:hypothetical protein
MKTLLAFQKANMASQNYIAKSFLKMFFLPHLLQLAIKI